MSGYLFVDGRHIGLDDFTEEVAHTAKKVEMRHYDGPVKLPALPAATDLWLENLPGLTEADTSAATVLRLENLPGLTEARP